MSNTASHPVCECLVHASCAGHCYILAMKIRPTRPPTVCLDNRLCLSLFAFLFVFFWVGRRGCSSHSAGCFFLLPLALIRHIIISKSFLLVLFLSSDSSFCIILFSNHHQSTKRSS